MKPCIGITRIAGFTAFLLMVSNNAANATSFVFNPTSVTEEFSNGEIFDDDVDVQGVSDRVTTLRPFDNITWTYKYTKGGPGYKVLSSDLADIDLLALSGRGTTGAKADVTLQFSSLNGDLVGTRYTFSGVSVEGPAPAIRDDGLSGEKDGDDILGSLKDLVIGDFHINVKITTGQFELTDMTFNWEAYDIEPVHEPSTICLLGVALVGLVGVGRKRLFSDR